VDLKTGRVTLVFAGILGIVAWCLNITQQALIFQSQNTPNELRLYEQLDPQTVKNMWISRRSRLALDVLSSATDFASNWLLLYGIFCVAKMFGKQRSGMTRSLMRFAFGVGTIIPAVELIENLGSVSAGVYISGHPELPDVGFQSLEIAYLMGIARSVWLFSTAYLFTAVGFFAVSYLSFLESGILSHKHAIFGMFLGCIEIVAFGLSIFVFYNNIISIVAAVVELLADAILFPIWTFWLAASMGQRSANAKRFNVEEMESNINDKEKQRDNANKRTTKDERRNSKDKDERRSSKDDKRESKDDH